VTEGNHLFNLLYLLLFCKTEFILYIDFNFRRNKKAVGCTKKLLWVNFITWEPS